MKLCFKKLAGGMLLGAVMLGCDVADDNAGPAGGSIDPAADRNSEAAREMRENAPKSETMSRVVLEQDSPVTGEVPEEYVAKVYADVEKRSGGGRADFELIRAEAVQWSDGSMGCPEPGMMYQQVIIDGYWVVVRYQDKEYDYRGNQRGNFTLCQGGPPPRASMPTQ